GAAIGILAALGLGAAGAIPALEAGAALRIGGAGHAGAVVADPAAAAVTVRLALRGGNAAVATRRIQLALEALLAVGVRTALLAEAVDADAAVTVDVAVLVAAAVGVLGGAAGREGEEPHGTGEEKDAIASVHRGYPPKANFF